MEAFARALRALPTTICDNAGLDSADIVATMRAAHGQDPEGTTSGVDIVKGAAGDMRDLGVYESFKVKQQVRRMGIAMSRRGLSFSHTSCGARGVSLRVKRGSFGIFWSGQDPAGTTSGVDIVKGAAGDMRDLGVYESFKVKQQVRDRTGGMRRESLQRFPGFNSFSGCYGARRVH